MLSSLRSTSGNRSRRVRAALLACGAALGVATALAAFPGCAQEGTTPTCDNNVTKDGILNKKANPCETFGKCYGTYKSSTEVDGTKYDTVEVCGSAQISDGTCGSTYGDAMVCCCGALSHVDTKAKVYIEYGMVNGVCTNKNTMEASTSAFDQCLYGYGEINLDTTGGGGGGTGGGGGGGAGGTTGP